MVPKNLFSSILLHCASRPHQRWKKGGAQEHCSQKEMNRINHGRRIPDKSTALVAIFINGAIHPMFPDGPKWALLIFHEFRIGKVFCSNFLTHVYNIYFKMKKVFKVQEQFFLQNDMKIFSFLKNSNKKKILILTYKVSLFCKNFNQYQSSTGWRITQNHSLQKDHSNFVFPQGFRTFSRSCPQTEFYSLCFIVRPCFVFLFVCVVCPCPFLCSLEGSIQVA